MKLDWAEAYLEKRLMRRMRRLDRGGKGPRGGKHVQKTVARLIAIGQDQDSMVAARKLRELLEARR